jgi:hypothetical protein
MPKTVQTTIEDSVAALPEDEALYLAAASIFGSRLALAEAFTGKSHRNIRDYDTTLGYPADISFADYRKAFRRGGIARRLIKLMPNLTWSDGCELVENEDPETETKLESLFAGLASRLNLWKVFRQADILQSIGEYSVVFIGAPGDTDQPLQRMRSPDLITYLKPYPQDRAVIEAVEEDASNPRYGLPVLYKLTPQSGLGSRWQSVKKTKPTASNTLTVHFSRILHVVDDPVEDELFSEPLLEAPWNYLIDLNYKVVGGGSEASWTRSDPGMHIQKKDDYAALDRDRRKAVQRQIDAYVHKLKRTLVTEGVDLTMLQATVDKFGANADSLVSLTLMTLGYPENVLKGNERGLRASETETNQLNSWKSHRQRQFGEPLIRQFVSRLQEFGALPKVDGYSLVWSEEEELNLKEKAGVAETLARANQASGPGNEVVTPDEMRDMLFGLEPLEREELAEEGEPEDDLEETEVLPEEEGEETEEDEEATDTLKAAVRSAASPRNSWDVVLDYAESQEKKFSSSLQTFFQSSVDSVDYDTLSLGLRAGTLDDALSLVVNANLLLPAKMKTFLHDTLLDTFNGAAEETLEFVANRGSWYDVPEDGNGKAEIESSAVKSAAKIPTEFFTSTSPRAIQWAAEHAATLVTKISFAQTQTLRSFVTSALQTGIPPASLARTLRETVPLLDRQVKALGNLRQRLLDAEPGSLVYAGKTKIRVPKDGFDTATLETKVQRYAKKLAHDRAKTIARTECLPGDTPVDSAVIGTVFRRRYEGYLAEIETANGRHLRATPNHPVLTSLGWCAAGDIKEGQYLVYDGGKKNTSAPGNVDVAASPLTIREIFDSVAAVGVVERKRTGEPDFHGDGPKGYVDVASPYWLLRLGSFSPIQKPAENFVFTNADQARLPVCDFCHGILSINKGAHFCSASKTNTAELESLVDKPVTDAKTPSYARLGFSGEIPIGYFAGVDLRSKVGSQSSEPEELLSGRAKIAPLDPRAYEDLPYPFRVCFQDLGDLVDTEPALVETDRVVSVRLRSFSGHVFNLSTPYGYFTSNGGVYTGNTLNASNRGQKELWLQAKEKDQIPSTVKRIWMATEDERTRDDHEEVNGEKVGIDEAFSIGEEPGSQPNCRCAQGLVRK